MARLSRVEVFAPDEIAIVHVMNRTVRRCFLMGDDKFTGKNYDHRKVWMESELKRLAAYFGIDLLCYAVMSNHFHLVLRSRPDVVETWNDREIARRWLMLCPKRKDAERHALEPTEPELNTLCKNRKKLASIRLRLSDISWWMRLLSQTIAQRANKEDEEVGKFWQARYKAVRLLDEASILACAAYVDLNPIRAAIAASLEASAYTSIQQRIVQLKGQVAKGSSGKAGESKLVPGKTSGSKSSGLAGSKSSGLASGVPGGVWWQASPGEHLSRLEIDERRDKLGPCPSSGPRASDKGFLPMTTAGYIDLLDWTARQVRKGKRGSAPERLKPIFERLGMSSAVWVELIKEFGRLFFTVAGKPHVIDQTRSRQRQQRYKASARTRELLGS